MAAAEVFGARQAIGAGLLFLCVIWVVAAVLSRGGRNR